MIHCQADGIQSSFCNLKHSEVPAAAAYARTPPRGRANLLYTDASASSRLDHVVDGTQSTTYCGRMRAVWLSVHYNVSKHGQSRLMHECIRTARPESCKASGPKNCGYASVVALVRLQLSCSG